ncbi:MAG: hypothetical protein KDC12_14900 [Flavobacteriales bacterium]|nr:hypothetical protein [Flavobacteriales bacterium]
MKKSGRFRRFTNTNPVVKPLKWWAAKVYFDRFLSDFINTTDKTEICVLGMRRTGNHAIIQWMISLIPGSVFFCNDAVPELPLHKAPIRKYIRKDYGGRYLLHSYEDKLPQRVWSSSQATRTGGVSARYEVVLLRDPFNLFASRYVWRDPQGERFRNDEQYRRELVALWKTTAREFLEMEQTDNPNRVAINYNRWFAEEDYRKLLCHRLGLEQAEGEREHIGEFGGGSSFDGQDSSGQGSTLEVLKRWHQVKDEPVFRSIFSDRELLDLSQEIFGTIPGTDEWLNP